MNPFRSFPAKVLLFGEYSVLLGSDAFSIPCHRYTSSLRIGFTPVQKGSAERSNHELQRFRQFLARQQTFQEILDLDAFGEDLNNFLWFDSTIPGSYGLGSSGALTAAVYDRYHRVSSFNESPDNLDLDSLKSRLARMEDCFHGTSSGLDPLVIFLNSPVIKRPVTGVQTSAFPSLFKENRWAAFLIDTGLACGTGARVEWFLKEFGPYGGSAEAGTNLSALTNKCIDHMLSGEHEGFRESLYSLSSLQFDYLEKLIPRNMKDFWTTGLRDKHYFMKLCGSGGGGYLLVFTDTKKAPEGALPVLMQ